MLVVEEILEAAKKDLLFPLNAFVLVKRLSRDTETASGIALPETAIVANEWCEVLASAANIDDKIGKRKSKLKAGDLVWIRPADTDKAFKLRKDIGWVKYSDVKAIKNSKGVVMPFDHTMLVRPPERQKHFAATSLLIPDSLMKKRSNNGLEGLEEGKVIHKRDGYNEVMVGDHIYFEPYDAPTIKLEGIEFLLVDERIVVGVKE